MPPRNKAPRWAQGLAAWDLLYTDPSGKLLDEVNAWLGGDERLKTGYRLEKFQFILVGYGALALLAYAQDCSARCVALTNEILVDVNQIEA